LPRKTPAQNFPDYSELIADLGAPIRQTLVLRRPKTGAQRFSYPFNRTRPGEIVLVVPRPGRCVLVHTKGFYPPDLYRLPTGGLHWGEPIAQALRRELREETGFELAPRQFLFHLEVRMVEGDRKRIFHSFGFLTEPANGMPEPQDRTEKISGFRDLPLEELEKLARRLRRLPPPWTLWGRFRARPHALAYRALLEREARGEPVWS
jgi:ADP-ribose pyrophosphatase YjhB (NUDIX family)